LLVLVGIICVTFWVAATISIAFQIDPHTISSKEQEQMHNPIHTSNENENLEKFKKEIKKADETRLKAIEMELLELARTNNTVKTDQELQETVNTDERMLEQVFVSPRKGGEISDMGGVPSICESWDENEAQGKQIAGILFNRSNWMCHPGAVGNKLGLYFHARAFASLHGVSFRITPNCHKAVDSLIAWLPQTVIPAQTNEIAAANITSVLMFNRTSKSFLHSMCNCGGPIAHQCKDGWPQLAGTWHLEIRSALESWALTAGKAKVEKGAVTIHFRCGDLLDPLFNGRGETGGMGFLKASFYLKHLSGFDLKSIHIVTSPLDDCSKEGSSGRKQDCKWGSTCSRIVDALANTLASSLELPREHFHVHDHESIMWSMHHIVFSEMTFCSPSTFCLFASLGSNHVIHTGRNFPSIRNTIPDVLKTFKYDSDGDYIVEPMRWIKGNDTFNDVNETVQIIIDSIVGAKTAR
jgi:hypothetical protein